MKKAIPRALLFASTAGLAAAGYMFFEAQWLQLQRKQLALPGLPPSLEGLKLLHVSDLHAGSLGNGSRAVSRFIETALRAEPDIVFFTGDMTDKKKDLTPYLNQLARLQAPYGKFAVLGNHDHGLWKTFVSEMARRMTGGRMRPGKKEVRTEDIGTTVVNNRRLLSQAGINLLENECVRIDYSGEEVQICGVDDFQYGYADIPGVSRELDPGAGLRILLSHSPDVVEIVPNGDYNLVLAGHTHGGQICLPHPTRGKILLSTSDSLYGEGFYPLRNGILHVSRGVGTTLVPLRLLSRPEITLLELTRRQ